MKTAIELQEVSKTYPGKVALDHLSLTVPVGSIFALLGDNGAGKSTTIRILNGLTPADSGSAHVLGHDTWLDAALLRRHIGYVPERPKFYDWMSVQEIGWFISGFQAEGYFDRYLHLTRQFLLEPRTKVSTLSKGQYAKVGLALALAIDPEVLILDEPTSGLDLLVRREFLGSMVGLAAEGRTIIISSHQIAEVERVASHVAFIAHGRLLLFASMEELRQRIVRLQLRWERQPPDPAMLGTVLQRNGAGKQLQAVLQDPRADALASLPHAEGIHDVEVTALHLEDIYCALLARKEDKS
jgi:ABC-2 type transport system ATP-binding protein